MVGVNGRHVWITHASPKVYGFTSKFLTQFFKGGGGAFMTSGVFQNHRQNSPLQLGITLEAMNLLIKKQILSFLLELTSFRRVI